MHKYKAEYLAKIMLRILDCIINHLCITATVY